MREETRVEVGESFSLEREIVGSAYVIADRTKAEERKGLMSCCQKHTNENTHFVIENKRSHSILHPSQC